MRSHNTRDTAKMARARDRTGIAELLCCVLAFTSSASALVYPAYCGADNISSIPPLDASFQVLQPKLAQVQVMIRHGDRLPCYPTECWVGDGVAFSCDHAAVATQTVDMGDTSLPLDRVYRKSYIPGREIWAGDCGMGTLTARGMAQEVHNGQNLRAAYVTGVVDALLPDSYGPDNAAGFYLRSDDSQRTIESGQALFDGLYPPPPAASADAVPTVEWWTMDVSREDIFPNDAFCPLLRSIQQSAEKSGAYTAHVAATTQPLVADCEAAFGVNMSIYDFAEKLDCLMTHVCYERPVPPAVDQSLFDRIIAEAVWQQAYVYGFGNYSRYGAGFLLGEVQAAMAAVVGGSKDAKQFVLYSGHDTGPIMPVLFALGVFDNKWAPYASLISIELWSLGAPGGRSSPWAVRFIYNGAVLRPAGCSSDLCDLSELNAALSGLVPASRAECLPPVAERPWTPNAVRTGIRRN